MTDTNLIELLAQLQHHRDQIVHIEGRIAQIVRDHTATAGNTHGAMVEALTNVDRAQYASLAVSSDDSPEPLETRILAALDELTTVEALGQRLRSLGVSSVGIYADCLRVAGDPMYRQSGRWVFDFEPKLTHAQMAKVIAEGVEAGS